MAKMEEKSTWKRKNKVGGLIPHEFKSYYKSYSIIYYSIVLCCKNRHKDEWSGIKSPKMYSYKYINLSVIKEQREFNLERLVFSTNKWCCNNWISMYKRKKKEKKKMGKEKECRGIISFIRITRIDHTPKCEMQRYKSARGVHDELLNKHQNHYPQKKKKTDKLNFIKIKTFCSMEGNC